MNKPVYASKGFGFFILSVVFLWGVCAWILLSGKASAPACGEVYRQDKTITINGHKLRAQVSKTSSEQEKGLGGRVCLGQDQAMLFIFDKPDYQSFWMKDMKFNIDIAWISQDMHVVDVQKNISPETYPKNFVGSGPAKYVIELPAGRANNLGIQDGNYINF